MASNNWPLGCVAARLHTWQTKNDTRTHNIYCFTKPKKKWLTYRRVRTECVRQGTTVHFDAAAIGPARTSSMPAALHGVRSVGLVCMPCVELDLVDECDVNSRPSLDANIEELARSGMHGLPAAPNLMQKRRGRHERSSQSQRP